MLRAQWAALGCLSFHLLDQLQDCNCCLRQHAKQYLCLGHEGKPLFGQSLNLPAKCERNSWNY